MSSPHTETGSLAGLVEDSQTCKRVNTRVVCVLVFSGSGGAEFDVLTSARRRRISKAGAVLFNFLLLPTWETKRLRRGTG